METRDDQGRTILMLACSKGQETIVELALKGGADVNQTDHHHNTALLMTARKLRNSKRSPKYRSILTLLLRAGADVNCQNEYGFTPLIEASSNGDLVTVHQLLVVGAHVNDRDSNGYSVLMWACDGCHLEIIKLLLSSGARTDFQDIWLGCTALMMICDIMDEDDKSDTKKDEIDVCLRNEDQRIEIVKSLLTTRID